MNIFAPLSNQNLQNHHLMDTKGLLNGPGQNNCFLNCAVQVSFYFHSEKKLFRINSLLIVQKIILDDEKF
jgi:ubiquitin C-terminal hydrolase